jgi:tetratricopeptide (TPR) repeat protein/TolB-like protein
MVGRTILHYTVTAKLGAGAMGQVYLARDERTERMVALKFLGAGTAGDPEASARLGREAAAAARLSHPNIVTLHAVEDSADGPFLVQEYVEGETLARRLERGPLGPVELMRLAQALTQALAHAHRHGVLHRDLKPGNVLVATDGAYKVADFGLARAEGAPALTATGYVVGTAAYLAPERARGHAGDARSDLFALGAVLYEAMTGRRAFAGETQADALYGVLHAEPRPPEAPNASLLPLAALVMRLLAKEPADRPASAEAVLEALETMRPAPAAAAVRRPRWFLPAAVALAVAVALAAAAWLHGRRGPTPADAETSVAVLYFENVANPQDPDRMGSITGNLLITALAQAPNLNVLSTQRILDVMRQLGRGTGSFDRAAALLVARRAHAGRIVTGSILQVVPALVMTAEVADVRSGRVICAERVEGEPGQSVFQVVDALGARLLGRLVRRDEAVRVVPVAERTSSDLGAQRHYLEGMERFAVGNLGEADSAFAAAAALDPSFAQAWYQLAITRWWGNEPEDARADIRRARANADRLSPLEREIIEGLADLVEHQTQDARTRFERLALAHPDEKLVLYGLEEACFHTNDFEGTVGAARRAFALDPAFTLPGRHLVDALGALGRYDEAWREGESLLRRDPRNQLLFDGLARLSSRRMRDADALLRLVRERQAAGFQPRSLAAALLLVARDSAAGAPALLAGDDTRPWVREEARLATDYFVALRHGRFHEASRLAARAWRLAAGRKVPNEATIPWAEGYFSAIRERDTVAVKAFADSITRGVVAAGYPVGTLYRAVMYGLAWVEMGRLPETRRELAIAEANRPRNLPQGWGPVHFLRARLRTAEGRHAEALAEIRDATWPAWGDLGVAMLTLERGRSLMGLGRNGEALAALDSLVRCPLGPPHEAVLLHYRRGQVLERLGRAGEATAAYREFLRLWRDADPGQPEVAEAKAALARLARRR